MRDIGMVEEPRNYVVQEHNLAVNIYKTSDRRGRKSVYNINIVQTDSIRLDSCYFSFNQDSVHMDIIELSPVFTDVSGQKYMNIRGNFFGSKPKVYAEYRDARNRIRKLNLSVVKLVNLIHNHQKIRLTRDALS